jgi:hypothetical protein
MPKPESKPEFLFISDHSGYYDTPYGCLRFVRIVDQTLVGKRYGITYYVPLSQATPARSTK